MLDRHEAHDDLTPKTREARDVAAPAERRLADREVPLPGMTDATADVVQAWLDGEASEADARRADSKAVDFWMRVNGDADRMKRMKTPSRVMANIMAAIPTRE